MAERDWDNSVSGHRQRMLHGSGFSQEVKSKIEARAQSAVTQQWRDNISSHSQALAGKDKQVQERTEQHKGRHDSSLAVKTKRSGETPRSSWIVASTTIEQMAQSDESGLDTQSLSSRSESESVYVYGGMESIQRTPKPDVHVHEVQRPKQLAGLPPSDVAERQEHSFAVGPLASLLKESSGTFGNVGSTSGFSLAPKSDLGTWRTSPTEAFGLSAHQRALWEQNRSSAAFVSGHQESMSLLGVAVGQSHEILPRDRMLSHPASTVFEVSVPREVLDFPDKVDGDALLHLTKEKLVVQCHLRDKLLEDSEKHEKEMAGELNRQEDQAKALEKENVSLKENCSRLLEENRQLKSRRVVAAAASTEERTLNEKSKWGATAILQMVTILYSCQIQDFIIKNMIAHGCEGAIFVATCKRQGSELLRQQVFALKVMFNIFGHSTFTKVRNFYQTEYQALCAMVPHPNIIRLYAFFYDRLSSDVYSKLPPEAAENARTLSLFLVMEHIPTDLEHVAMDRRKAGKLTSKQVMQWTLDILTGIEHLLKHRYLHRDLKLNNILVSEEETLKLCDFGCSIQLQEDMSLLYTPGSSLGGNPAHMPPEALNAVAGRHLHCGSQDLWACGVLVYEMAGGNSPLFGLDQQGYRMSDLPKLVIKNEKSGVVSEGSTIFPEDFCRLVFSLLEFEPSKRPSVHRAIKTTTDLLH